MQILRSCVNWRERNRRVIVISRVSKDSAGSPSLAHSRFFALPTYYNNNPVAFHLRFRRTLFNILSGYSRGAVLQFIRRRWQRQPPAGSSGLIKFTDLPFPALPSSPPPPLRPPSRHGFRLVKVTTFAFHLGKATIRVTIRFSRSPEVGTPKPRPPLGSRARASRSALQSRLFFSPLLPSLCSLLYAASRTFSRALFLSGCLYATIDRTKRSL